MKPYKNLNSHNLGVLLLLARITVYLGALVVFASLVFFIFAYTSPTFGPFAYAILAYIPASIVIFLISGIMAAIVSFEDNYRKRTEFILSEHRESN